MDTNELIQSGYNRVTAEPRKAATTAVLAGVAIYWATNALWPVILLSLAGGLFVAYGAGLEELEERDVEYE